KLRERVLGRAVVAHRYHVVGRALLDRECKREHARAADYAARTELGPSQHASAIVLEHYGRGEVHISVTGVTQAAAGTRAGAGRTVVRVHDDEAAVHGRRRLRARRAAREGDGAQRGAHNDHEDCYEYEPAYAAGTRRRR